MLFDYRVPVGWMPIGDQVPDFLKASTTRSETGGLKSMMSDECTV